MNDKDLSLMLETQFRKIYQTEERYSDTIRYYPREAIFQALATAREKYPDAQETIDYLQARYSDMEEGKLATLIERGYDIEGIIEDFKQLVEQLNEE